MTGQQMLYYEPMDLNGEVVVREDAINPMERVRSEHSDGLIAAVSRLLWDGIDAQFGALEHPPTWWDWLV